MGAMMAAALLAKGYLFGALLHSGLAHHHHDVIKRRPLPGYGGYYDLYGRLHPRLAAVRKLRKVQ